MAPFHLPWPTFGAFLVLGGTLVLAFVWAMVDLRRDQRRDRDAARRDGS
jgi:hypothetical protein